MEMMETILDINSRQSFWTAQSSVQNGDRQFKAQSGDHQFKVANRQFINRYVTAWPLMGTEKMGLSYANLLAIFQSIQRP